MTRFILPIILIVISISLFFTFTDPIYTEISTLKEEATSYNQALDNSKQLENERDKLTAKYNSFRPEDLANIEKLLPDNVNNIRLILEIEQIASPYGMVLRDVGYDSGETVAAPNGAPVAPQAATVTQGPPKDYGTFYLSFSTSGSYTNFINFTKDLEKNLRIVDISSIEFSSDTGVASHGGPEVYNYNFKIKTYWLKN